jgi:hypothetical protein
VAKYNPRGAMPQPIGSIMEVVLASYGISSQNAPADTRATAAKGKKAQQSAEPRYQQLRLF